MSDSNPVEELRTLLQRTKEFVGGRYELFTDRKRPMTGRIVTWQPSTLLEFTWTLRCGWKCGQGAVGS